MKLLLDTSAYSHYFRGDERVVHLIRSAEALLLPAIVLGELFAGFALGGREKKNLSELEQFLSSPRVSVVNTSEESARLYAEIYCALRSAGQGAGRECPAQPQMAFAKRSAGKPIPTNDLWIAALAREHGAALVSFDAHFNYIAGLRVLPDTR